ncbi:MAG: ATP-binding cassette domain-containing protein, partial [Phycisphaerae bacterium]
KYREVGFALRRGEILGIEGMLRSWRTELLRGIFGADRVDGGAVWLEGKRVVGGTPKRMKGLGVGFVPENRKEQALVLGQSIRTNLCLASMNRVGWCGMITSAREQRVTEGLIERLAIKVADAGLPIDSLSGGNQQKIVVGKWLNTKPRVMLFDEPTRGIDVQAKQHIFQMMWDLSREGIGSIFVSSELEELVEVCHRILIMKGGRIAGEVMADGVTVDELVVRCMQTEEARGAA